MTTPIAALVLEEHIKVYEKTAEDARRAGNGFVLRECAKHLHTMRERLAKVQEVPRG